MLKLTKRNDTLFAQTSEEGAPVAVRVVYARPISDRDGEVSIVKADGGEEVAWLGSLDELDPPSRALAEAALAERYVVGVIEEVTDSFVNHGHRYLKVVTNRGRRYFNLKEPGTNVTYLGDDDDRLVIRDSMGNRYEVPSLSAIDPGSRERLDEVL